MEGTFFDPRSALLRYARMHGTTLHPTALKILVSAINARVSSLSSALTPETAASAGEAFVQEFFAALKDMEEALSSSTQQQPTPAAAAAAAAVTTGMSTVTNAIAENVLRSLAAAAAQDTNNNNNSITYTSNTSTSSSMISLSDAVVLINANECPRVTYCPSQKKWLVGSDETSNNNSNSMTQTQKVLGSLDERLALCEQRLLNVQQRMIRHPLFRPSGGQVRLLTVAALEGAIPGTEVYVLGIMRQVTADRTVLEDVRQQVDIDVSRAHVAAGYLASGSVVVVHALWTGDVLKASALGLPPCETRTESIASAPANFDFFGKPIPQSRYDVLFRAEQDKEINKTQLFVLFDVMLDVAETRHKLSQMMKTLSPSSSGYDPRSLIFVLCGKFSSHSNARCGDPFYVDASTSEKQRVTALFDSLAEIVVANAPAIATHSRFILVPSPEDSFCLGGNSLPQRPIPNVFVRTLRSKLENVQLATNPCRLRIFTREIVIFRSDIVQTLYTNAIMLPTGANATSAHDHVVKTLLDEGHLSPLCPSLQPVAWHLDHSLRLYPLPHTLILCDGSQVGKKGSDESTSSSSSLSCWETEFQSCVVLNPGPLCVNQNNNNNNNNNNN
eukprot:PhM_4_TR18027/c4_g1_i2/m.93070/K02325/POLE2; DNA polymerase epsilon subunit 2